MVRKASVGIERLIEKTAGGKLRGSVIVDQVYAADQHETLYYRHPRGGRAKYLEGPMFENYAKWFQNFADNLLKVERSGKTATERWADVTRALKREVPKHAPREFGDLAQSASLRLQEGTRVVVREPAQQPRLTEQELDAKDYMRDMGVGYR